jgi:hypothetical protein
VTKIGDCVAQAARGVVSSAKRKKRNEQTRRRRATNERAESEESKNVSPAWLSLRKAARDDPFYLYVSRLWSVPH